MLQVGDRVRVKATVGGPDVLPNRRAYRLLLWGQTGIIIDIVPELNRPIVVGFADPNLPRAARFWGYDLLVVQSDGGGNNAAPWKL